MTDKVIGGQVYQFICEEPYSRKKDGKAVMLGVWESHCAECGAAFQVRVSTRIAEKRFEVNRRCQLHKRPGVRVKAA